MINKEIIKLVRDRTTITNNALIEKDLILHRLLIELSSNKDFFDSYAFKGGTCLMKCYISYYRFSEDLDFTYIHQREFANKSGQQRRKIMSGKINELLIILKNISDKIGLDFKPAKGNRRYVELGSSNKQTTFKLWYLPEGSETELFIKIQINFLEELEYPLIEREAEPIIIGKYDKFSSAFLLPEGSEWVMKIPKLKCYDIREILIEKVRAILTRRGTKARDYIDIYMIEKNRKIDVVDYKNEAIKKIKTALKFDRYKTNFKERKKSDFSIDKNEEKAILLIDLPEDFDSFMNKLQAFLIAICKEFS